MGKVFGTMLVVAGGVYVLYRTKPELFKKLNAQVAAATSSIKDSFMEGYSKTVNT